MQEHPAIFSVKEIKNRIKNAFVNEIPNQKQKIQVIENWQKNISSGKYIKAKEEEIKPLFLTQFFGEILGYDYNNSTDWNLRLENKTATDSTKSDAALGFFKIRNNEELPKDVRVVIEIKDARTPLDKPQNRKDFKGSPVEQCFNYAAKIGENCKWVIVSNFLEIRLYLASDMTKYESFDVMSLTDNYEFSRFYYLLANGQLFYENTASSIDILLANRIEKEKTITKAFYEFYHFLRELFFYHLKNHNPQIAPLQLLEYAQTIIDRIVFVSVVKDYDLLPYNVLKEIEDIANKSWERDKLELWRQLKKFFVAMDEGLPPRIHKFNGGLFKQNSQIDALIIKDVFLKQLLSINNYDFESDLNINVLGHIFEQSITDIEVFKKNIVENIQFEYTETDDKIDLKTPRLSTNKRKKEGIFYTPENITAYIIKSTIGAWLDEKKNQLGLNSLADYPSDETEKNRQIKLWEQYQNILKNIKILDPACGSGAFLTQAFDYLLREWQMVLDVINKLKDEKIEIRGNGLFSAVPNKTQQSLAQIKKNIVNNNLFGVDLNSESVEITKLGLWLKSASKNDPLALLDSNIKCGNSLIADKNITEKAFDWEVEFADIMQNGGFDVVVGNPPYGIFINSSEEDYFKQNFPLTNYKINLYVLFIERIFQIFTSGLISLIIPKSLLFNVYYKNIREHIIKKSHIKEILTIAEKVFEDAEVGGSLILTFEIKKELNPENITQLIAVDKFTDLNNRIGIFNKIQQNKFLEFNNFEISIIPTETQSIIDKLIHNQSLSTQYDFKNGLNPGNIKHILISDKKISPYHQPIIWGKDISKYYIDWSGDFVNYDVKLKGKIAVSEVKSKKGMQKQEKIDFALRNPEMFETPKLVIRKTSDSLIASYDTQNYYFDTLVHGIYAINQDYDLKYLLAILNSKPATFFYRLLHDIEGKAFAKISLENLEKFPLPKTSLENRKNLSQKADLMLNLRQQLNNQSHNFLEILKADFQLVKPNEKLQKWYQLDWVEFSEEMKKMKVPIKTHRSVEWIEVFKAQKIKVLSINKQIEQINWEIDEIVYDIYGLNESEKNIIRQVVL